MHREMLVAMQAGRFARLEKLDRDPDAPFRRGSNLFELSWQTSERERSGESGSDKEMSHPRWTLTGNCVSNNGQTLLSSAARRSAGSAAKYWATVEAVMLATMSLNCAADEAHKQHRRSALLMMMTQHTS
jgi:hypothetical protein